MLFSDDGQVKIITHDSDLWSMILTFPYEATLVLFFGEEMTVGLVGTDGHSSFREFRAI